MKPFLRVLSVGLVAIVLVPPNVFSAPPEPPREIYVASKGRDGFNGNRLHPKRTFQAAHDAVAAGGQIIALDTSDYGPLAITKSVSVIIPHGISGFISVSDGNDAIAISAAAADNVTLRGLIITHGGSTPGGGKGIVVNSAGAVTIQDCTVRNFVVGLNCFLATDTQLRIDNCDVRNCGDAIELANKINQAATSVVASINGCRLRQNTAAGINAIGQNSSVDVTMADCFIEGNNIGILSQTPGGANTCIVRVDNCRITGNTTKGVGITNSGQVLSRGNNTLEKNAAGNTFPGTYSAK